MFSLYTIWIIYNLDIRATIIWNASYTPEYCNIKSATFYTKKQQLFVVSGLRTPHNPAWRRSDYNNFKTTLYKYTYKVYITYVTLQLTQCHLTIKFKAQKIQEGSLLWSESNLLLPGSISRSFGTITRGNTRMYVVCAANCPNAGLRAK